jgi:hypothetical protein
MFLLLQLEHALGNKKSLFENVNIDWNLFSAEDASTDFSDDELEDKVRDINQRYLRTQNLFFYHLMLPSVSSFSLFWYFIPSIFFPSLSLLNVLVHSVLPYVIIPLNILNSEQQELL